MARRISFHRFLFEDMSLDQPTKTERLVTWIKDPQYRAVKIGSILLVVLFVIGAALFLFAKGSTYLGNRNIDKARANVNAALANVNAAKAVVGNDKVNEAVVLEQVNRAVGDAVNASTATDAAKANTNAALANYAAAVNANRPTGTTEADLDKALRELGQ